MRISLEFRSEMSVFRPFADKRSSDRVVFAQPLAQPRAFLILGKKGCVVPCMPL